MNFGDTCRISRRFGFLQQSQSLFIRFQHDLDQRFLCAGGFLRHLTDTGVFRDGNIAGIRRQFTGNHLEQGRLAGAVTPDKTGL